MSRLGGEASVSHEDQFSRIVSRSGGGDSGGDSLTGFLVCVRLGEVGGEGELYEARVADAILADTLVGSAVSRFRFFPVDGMVFGSCSMVGIPSSLIRARFRAMFCSLSVSYVLILILVADMDGSFLCQDNAFLWKVS